MHENKLYVWLFYRQTECQVKDTFPGLEMLPVSTKGSGTEKEKTRSKEIKKRLEQTQDDCTSSSLLCSMHTYRWIRYILVNNVIGFCFYVADQKGLRWKGQAETTDMS